MVGDISSQDIKTIRRFRSMRSRISSLQEHWIDSSLYASHLLDSYASGKMGLRYDDSGIGEVHQLVPPDEETFSVIATIISWTTEEDQDVHYLKVVDSIRRLEKQVCGENTPSRLRDTISALDFHWKRVIEPSDETVGYRGLAPIMDLPPLLPRQSALRALADQWMQENVARGEWYTWWQDDGELAPSDKYCAAVMYYCRLILMADHTLLTIKALEGNGRELPWEHDDEHVPLM